MGDIIAVWGKSGAGVSTTCANIATVLSKNNTVGIIGGRKDYGSIQHYFGMEIPPERSIKKAIEFGDYADYFVKCPSNANICVLSLSNSEDAMSLETITKESCEEIIKAGQEFDYLVIDCPQSFTESFTGIGCWQATYVIEVVEPTVQGLAFALSHKTIKEKLCLQKKLIPVLNLNKNYISIKELESKLGFKFHEILPYNSKVELSCIKGIPVCASNKWTWIEKSYTEGIKRICKRIEMAHSIRQEAL